MTLGANMIEIVLHVTGIGDGTEVTGVTVVTSRRRADITAGMAGNALEAGMSSGQRECRCRVIERRWLPGCCVVTIDAIVIKVVRRVVRVRRGAEITAVTRVAITAGIGISGGMARYARQSRMAAGQHEAGCRMIEG